MCPPDKLRLSEQTPSFRRLSSTLKFPAHFKLRFTRPLPKPRAKIDEGAEVDSDALESTRLGEVGVNQNTWERQTQGTRNNLERLPCKERVKVS